jgi:hypothetical protein
MEGKRGDRHGKDTDMAKILATSEMIIQRLLSEAGVGSMGDELVPVDARGIEAAAVRGSLKSPESYIGCGRTDDFASPSGIMPLYHALTSLTFVRFPRGCA